MAKHFTQAKNFVQCFEENHSKTAPIYYMLLSSFLYATSTLLSKQIPRVPMEELVFIEAIVMLSLNQTIVSQFKMEIYKSSTLLTTKLILRGVLGCISTMLFYSSLKYLTVSEGIVLYRTSLVWTTIIAIVYLKNEKFEYGLVVNIVICLLGITLIAQPPFLTQLIYGTSISKAHHLFGVCLMIMGAMLSSSIQVLIKSMASEVQPIVILQYFSFISLIMPSATLFIWPKQLVIPNHTEILHLILIGLASYFSQLLMSRAFQKGTLSEVSMTAQTQVLYSYVFQILMGQEISFLSTLGSLLIVSTCLSIIIRKSRKQQTLPR